MPAKQFSSSLFHFGQNQPDELTPLIKLLVPTRLIFHGIKERLLQRACKVSVPPKGTGTNKNQQFGCWIGACFVENPCWEEALACVSRLCFSHLQQLLPECRLSAALLWLSVLVRRFLMWATATCSNSCCFRSVITRAFGFCLVWTEEDVADAAAHSRQVCRSEPCWQQPAPPPLEVPSCVWVLMNLACPGLLCRMWPWMSHAPVPVAVSNRRVWCRRQALTCAPTGAVTRSWLRSTQRC